MMNIEIVSENNVTSHPAEKTGRIVINGEKDVDSFLRYKHLYIKKDETFQKIVNASYDDLTLHIDDFSYTFNAAWCEYPLRLAASFPKIKGDERYIWVCFDLNYMEWNHPYSIANFVRVHEQFISQSSSVKFVEIEDARNEMIGNFFFFEIIMQDSTKPVKHYVDLLLSEVRSAHLAVLDFLKYDLSSEQLSVAYKFPTAIRAACHQYLIYFAQFLADLGIQSETSLRANAGTTLFTVCPKDKTYALENIYHALQFYLAIASEQQTDLPATTDIAQIQWQQTILHLQQQLQMQHVVIEAKDETIRALNISNYQLISFLPDKAGSVNEKTSSEEILGGLATVDNLKLKGVTLRLPEIFRRLKRRFTE
jgi:hypothetical protein